MKISPNVACSVLSLIFAGACALQPVHAEVYTWTDASGRVNVSNLPPPAGVRVTSVIRESPEAVARVEAAREAARQAEVQALSDRVQQLEREVDVARRTPPMPPYPVAAPPAAVQNTFVMVQPPVQDRFDAPPPVPTGCGYGGLDCGYWWGPGVYPASILVLSAPNVHRMRPGHGTHRVVDKPPRQPRRPSPRG